MNRVGFQFKVRQDHLAEYKEHHKSVWQEMLDAHLDQISHHSGRSGRSSLSIKQQ